MPVQIESRNPNFHIQLIQSVGPHEGVVDLYEPLGFVEWTGDKDNFVVVYKRDGTPIAGGYLERPNHSLVVIDSIPSPTVLIPGTRTIIDCRITLTRLEK